MNILLTCAGRRHYLVRYFKETLGGLGRVIGADLDLTAPALSACDVVYKVPGVFESDYLVALQRVIDREKIDMVFSLNDLEIGLLADHRDEIESASGARLYVPRRREFEICADKWCTYTFSRELGLPAIGTFLEPQAALAAVASGEIQFPLIVKPRWGSASIGLRTVWSEKDLESAFLNCAAVVTASVLAPLGDQDAVIIQEVIEGPEFGVDILYGLNESVIGFTAKRKLAMRAGETDKAVTVAPGPFADAVRRIGAHLPHRGNLDCDFMMRDGELYLLEMNPRFGGGYPFTHEAGANHVAQLLAEYKGEALPSYSYQEGVAFAKCDTLVAVPSPN